MISSLMISLVKIKIAIAIFLLYFIGIYDIIVVGGSMVYFWVSMIILLTIIEVCSVNLTTIWFVASALVALIVSMFYDDIVIQVGIFAILGILLLITTKPLLKKFIKVDKVKTNLDRVIGMKGVVTEKILPLKLGEVKVDGKRWTAFSDEELDEDEVVKILNIDGVKLKVEKWEV